MPAPDSRRAGPGRHHRAGEGGAGLGPPREGHLFIYPPLYDRPGRRPGRPLLPPCTVYCGGVPCGRLLPRGFEPCENLRGGEGCSRRQGRHGHGQNRRQLCRLPPGRRPG